MALHVSAAPAEDEELYSQLLRLRDVVIAGKHAHIKLPPSAVEQLKVTLGISDDVVNSSADHTHGVQSTAAGLYTSKPAASAGLDPIFLEKSDSLVRAEGQLKRQRIERELQAQVDQRKHTSSRDRDPGADGPSRIDIDAVLLDAHHRVKPLSGLKPTEAAGSETSFDENDYYSSLVQSDWSSDVRSSKESDHGAGAFTADFERLEQPAASASFAEPSISAKHRALLDSALPHPSQRVHASDPDDDYEPDDEDDEYTPPDAAAFDSFRADGAAPAMQQLTPPEDDNSDYEPGEITQDSAVPTPYDPAPQAAQPSPRVPVIRNHLTHIAAPQPNRVSPLATAKGPSIELELVNGRPEVVQKPQARSAPFQSRASTASPSANGTGASGRKRRNKKRKRDQEPPNTRSKRRRERAAAQSPVQREPYIKDEPVSPPPFAQVLEARVYDQLHYAPPSIDLVSPRPAPQVQYTNEHPRSALRYEYAPQPSPTAVRAASPGDYRPVPRDTQDLRRVATLHAQRPASPRQGAYSPVAPYHSASMTYGEQPLQPSAVREAPRYQEVPMPEHTQYVRPDRPPSPRLQGYRDPHVAKAQSPALMPPPPPRRIVVDQYGNRYYAAEPAPPIVASRASVAPIERRLQPEQFYERAPSRLTASYAQTPTAAQLEPADPRIAPPPSRHQPLPEQATQYVDTNGYRVREYSTRPAEPARYSELPPTSPVYQSAPQYQPMPPPPVQTPVQPESTSAPFVPTPYSVRPEEPVHAPASYVRQTSVAPMQYARQDMAPPPPPVRAMSVMPVAADYGAPTQQRAYSYAPAPQPVRYVDQYGNEVFPKEVRQMSEFRYH